MNWKFKPVLSGSTIQTLPFSSSFPLLLFFLYFPFYIALYLLFLLKNTDGKQGSWGSSLQESVVQYPYLWEVASRVNLAYIGISLVFIALQMLGNCIQNLNS